MPTQKRFKCLRCEAEFDIATFTAEEQIAARRRNPNQNFGPVTCPNPNCRSTDVVESGVLRGR